MLARAIAALREAGATEIAVVGGSAVRDACAHSVEAVIDEHASGRENLLRALRAWPHDRPLLYATSDLPYITGQSVRDFLAAVPADTLAVPLTEFDAYAARFPSAPAAGITLAGERVVNGGVFFVPAGAAATIATVATRLFDARKQPWRMAKLVSPGAMLAFLLKRLRIADVEREATRALGVPARAIRNSAPELAFDADSVAEYRYACAHD